MPNDLYAAIVADLHRRYASSTYQAIASETGVAYTYIRSLMLGAKPASHMSLDVFFRLFPRAEVRLDGGAPSAPPAPSITQTASPRAQAAINLGGDLAAYRGRLALALASLDLSPESLAAVMRTVASTQ